MKNPIGTVEIFNEQTGTRIAISGEIDLSNVDEIQGVAERALSQAPEATIDLRAVTFMGSEGVRLIYELSDSMGNSENLRVLVRPNGIPAQVLKMTRMDERVTIVTDSADTTST